MGLEKRGTSGFFLGDADYARRLQEQFGVFLFFANFLQVFCVLDMEEIYQATAEKEAKRQKTFDSSGCMFEGNRKGGFDGWDEEMDFCVFFQRFCLCLINLSRHKTSLELLLSFCCCFCC